MRTVGAIPGTVELLGHESAVPGEDGRWFGNAGYLRQSFPSKPLADFGERRSLWIG
jgi:hypothetical protein